MFSLPGYQVAERLYESRNSRIYRGRRCRDDLPVIFKVLNNDVPSAERQARFQREYHLTRSLQLDGVAGVYGLEALADTLVILGEDFGGKSLDLWKVPSALTLPQWLNMALAISACLEQLHKRQVTHKDINPSNIVWNRTSGQLKLIDLGISTELTRELLTLRNPDRLEGSLAYMSPEQTGRMNRVIDYRTDFYSLGVSFYQLLTGKLPFEANDPLELVHAHLARVAQPVHLLRPEIPPTLAAIVSKLMAKNADERYQSCAGLQADLQACLEALTAGTGERAIVIGSHDFASGLQLPQKLYGREAELATLLDAFAQAERGHPSLLLVAGYSGIGKSALVREVRSPAVHAGGYFIEGKFDQFKRNLPYVSLLQALRDWVHQVLTENDERLTCWRSELQAAVGQLGQVIAQLIPEVKLIIGPQPPVPDLPPDQGRNRLHTVFRQFIHAIARSGRPLVIFLDDLQWTDPASLALMGALLEGRHPHLLLIGAYRDNEVSAAHPLIHALHHMRQAGIVQHTVQVAPLSLANIVSQLSDTLRVPPGRLQELAQLCLEKTQGNPFFLGQFLGTLETQGMLRHCVHDKAWQWDIGRIRAANITDNVVDLMLTKLRHLPPPTRRVLQWAACLGNVFDLRRLALVCGQAEAATANALSSALAQGLVLPIDERYKYAGLREQLAPLETPTYRFLHDRVQQAAIMLIEPARQAAMHLSIGRRWQQVLSAREQNDLMFELVNHLNLGASNMTDATERTELAERNLLAAQRAKASAAHGPALHYAESGLALLARHGWQHDYRLMLALYLEAAETAYLGGNFSKLDHYIDIAMNRATGLLDRVQCQEIRLQALITRGRLAEAITLGLHALQQLGVAIPSAPGKRHLIGAALRTKLVLFRKKTEMLAAMDDMTAPHALAAVGILMRLTSAAYYAGSGHLPLIVFKLVQLSVRFGTAPASPFAYVCYGGILCGVTDEFHLGRQFGALTLEVLDKRPEQANDARTRYLMHLGIQPWQDRLRATLPLLAEDHIHCLNASDLEFAGNSAASLCSYSMFAGVDLDTLEKTIARYYPALEHLHKNAFNGQKVLWQALRNLTEAPDQPAMLRGPIFDEETHKHFGEDGSLRFYFHLWKLILAYLHHDLDMASNCAAQARTLLGSAIGQYTTAAMHFYESLCCAALLAKAAAPVQAKLRARIKANQRKMALWARHAPSNFQHKWHLVEAEVDMACGRAATAMPHYEQAIVLARRWQFTQEEALACELAGHAQLTLGNEAAAKQHLVAAYSAYQQWGARSKLRQLEARYPSWLGRSYPAGESLLGEHDNVTVNGTSSSESLDFASLSKALQAITSELVLERLLASLVSVAVENAGAQKGLLLLRTAGGWRIEAERDVMQGGEVLVQARMVGLTDDAGTGFATSLLHYVDHTRASCVVHDAVHDHRFANDHYVQQQRPRSLLCVPIARNGEVLGAIYLENRIAAGIFTIERLGVIGVLAGQAAISIENARLYANMENRVRDRTAELQQAYEKLQDTQQHLVLSEKMASLGTLTAGVAHEINNPVNFAHAGAQVLQSEVRQLRQFLLHLAGDNADPDILDALNGRIDRLLQRADTIVEGTSRIRELVKDLRSFSRLGEAEKKIVPCNEILLSTIHLVRSQYSRSAKILCTLPADPRIECWPAQLGQVFMNIVVNACQAIEQKWTSRRLDGTGLLEISNNIEHGHVVYRFTDNGSGIPAALLGRIFEPFFTTKTVGEGTGLGLSISYGIVKKHHGDIEVQSLEGQGSTFLLRLPLCGG